MPQALGSTPLSPFTISSASSASEFQPDAIRASLDSFTSSAAVQPIGKDGRRSGNARVELPTSVVGEEEEEEEIQRFLMETNISDVPFLDLWKIMHKKLGWKYIPNKVKYQAPQTSLPEGEPILLVFDSAIDVVAFLDGHDPAISKYSNTNSSSNSKNVVIPKLALQWKRDILTAYYPTFKIIKQQNHEKELQKQNEKQESHRKLTYGFGESGAICDVCFQLEGNPSSSTSFSPFVSCKTCSLLVHYDCYLPLPRQQQELPTETTNNSFSTNKRKKRASFNISNDKTPLLGKGCAVPNVGLDKEGFFQCDVCRQYTNNKNTQKDKKEIYYYMKDEVEAKCDGRIQPDATCELCLRKDVCGGLKQLAATKKGWVHLACVQCIAEAFCHDNKIHFGATKGKKSKTVQELLKCIADNCNGSGVAPLCDACSRPGGYLVPCSSTSSGCEHRLHPLCAELSLRKRHIDKTTSCVSYKCALHSFTEKCNLCNQVHFQKDMIECNICTHRFHKRCLQNQTEKSAAKRNHRIKPTSRANDNFLAGYADGNIDENFCNSCLQEGLAKGTLIEVKQSSGSKKVVKFARKNTQGKNSSESSPQNILSLLKIRTKTADNNEKNKRSVTAIEDGAEIYFTKYKKNKTSASSRRSSSKQKISPSDVANSETEDGENSEEQETENVEKGAAVSRPGATKKKRLAKPTGEELLSKWPNPQECVDFLSTQNPILKHSYQISEIERKHKDNFSEWSFLLKTNHSLLLYGYGSKRHLLNDFSNKLSEEGHCVANIQGYCTDVTISGILDSLVIGFLNGKEPSLECDQQLFSASHRLVKRAQCIARKLAAGSNSLYIILHNIDGIGLRNAVAQSSLATLVVYGMVDNVRRIRLVASMDHVNAAAFLWDARTNAGFSWLWKEVTTFRPYDEEVRYGIPDFSMAENKVMGNQRRSDKGIKDVLQSLAPRYSETLKLLATLQLASDNAGTDIKMTSDGVEYSVFRVHCQNKMLVTSDNALRLMLNELKDHDIVSFKVGKDGNERIYIPYTQNVLQMIIDF